MIVAAVPAKSAQYTLKIGSPTINDTYHHWMRLVKAKVEGQSGGQIAVELYPASQLGAIPRMVEGVQFGTIEMIQVPAAFLGGVDPRYAVVDSPGLFRDLSHGYRTGLQPEFAAALRDIGEARGIRTVGFTCEDWIYYATLKPIRKLDDFNGKKIRVFGSSIERATLAKLGATALPMPPDEVIQALQTGAIDGTKAGMTLLVPFKYFNVTKFALLAEDSMICGLKLVSKHWFDRLPRELQSVVLEETAKASEENLPFILNFVEKVDEHGRPMEAS